MLRVLVPGQPSCCLVTHERFLRSSNPSHEGFVYDFWVSPSTITICCRYHITFSWIHQKSGLILGLYSKVSFTEFEVVFILADQRKTIWFQLIARLWSTFVLELPSPLFSRRKMNPLICLCNLFPLLQTWLQALSPERSSLPFKADPQACFTRAPMCFHHLSSPPISQTTCKAWRLHSAYVFKSAQFDHSLRSEQSSQQCTLIFKITSLKIIKANSKLS